MKRLFVILLLLSFATHFSCKKKTDTNRPESAPGALMLKLNHEVDSKLLDWNKFYYKNEAGEIYSLDRIQYYLSGFRFYYQQQLVSQSDSVYFIDAEHVATLSLLIPEIKSGDYDSIAFYIGIAPEKNISNSLPATIENNEMSWPDVMGGGYHFMKLEGHWEDSADIVGFAMHLGNNNFHVPTGIVADFKIEADKQTTLRMTMNINEWFRKPNVYSFANDGVYSMGNAVLMKKIAENGHNVFKME